ncbi:hypothetical protein GCM10010172_10630 [Paractinoplanes ferrugineus]
MKRHTSAWVARTNAAWAAAFPAPAERANAVLDSCLSAPSVMVGHATRAGTAGTLWNQVGGTGDYPPVGGIDWIGEHGAHDL